MTHENLKQNLKALGLDGAKFARLLGKQPNYISNMKHERVPENISIIINLMLELNKHISKDEIIKIVEE